MKTEGHLHTYAKKRANLLGIYARKLVSKSIVGFPDWIFAKRGRVIFTELKSPAGTGSLSVMQDREHKKMRNAGLDTRVASNQEEIDVILHILN